MSTCVVSRRNRIIVNLQNVAQVAQIAGSIGTVAAVSFSLYLARKSSTELRVDRRLRFHPVLAFESSGWLLVTERVRFAHRIGGIDPVRVEQDFGHLNKDSLCIHVTRDYGQLQNIGMGPALDVHVTWRPVTISLKNDEFTVDEKKLAEYRYSEEYNCLPASPRIIEPGSSAELTRIPIFLALDFEQDFRAVDGQLAIHYKDISGRNLETRQNFLIWSQDTAGDLSYGVTFGDILQLPRLDAT